MSFYAQTDNRWKNELLGFNTEQPYNLGNFGCLITAYGNMLIAITANQQYTPEWVNNWLKANNGFVAGGGIMYWTAPLALGHVTAQGTTTDLATVNNWLKSPPNYAILEVKNSAGGQHFVLGNLVNTIIDSEDGKQKPMGTYPFVQAHLYTAIEAESGTITTSTTSTGDDDVAMTADEETQAYEIVLNSPPDHAVPDGRTAMQFILGAKAQLDIQRANNVAQVAALNQQVSNLTAKLAATTPVSSVPDEPDFTLTMQDDDRPRVAGAAGVSIDFTGESPDKPFAAGTIFHQAEVYVIDGVIMIRTHTSVDGNTWYLTDQMYFDDTPAVVPTSTIHAQASMAVGVVSRLINNLVSIFKKKDTK